MHKPLETPQAAALESDAQMASPPCPLRLIDCPCQVALGELWAEVERLRSELRTDRLTGLGNYRRFTEALAQEMARTQRNGRPMALIIADLDHFKRVNDKYGHEVGNLALAHVAQLWRQTSRNLDVVCRYGGEEVVFLLPDTELPAAIKMAERHRRYLEQTPLYWEGQVLHLTASFGVAVYRCGDMLSPAQLVAEADRWLYRAKAEGRNRVGHPPPAPVASAKGLSLAERAALFAPDRKSVV